MRQMGTLVHDSMQGHQRGYHRSTVRETEVSLNGQAGSNSHSQDADSVPAP